MDATRRRIVEAAVALYGTVGPADTSISAVAERAGVTRATLYRHFPTEADLFDAGTRDWLAAHPSPDADAWPGIADPERRLRFALRELYDWFVETQPMTANLLRDLAILPEIHRTRIAAREAGWSAALADGWAEGEADVEAAIAIAVTLDAWRALARAGRSTPEAADLMTRMVLAARPA